MKDLDISKIFDSMKANDISEVIIKEGSKQYEFRRGGFKNGQGSAQAQQVVQAAIAPQAAVQTQAPVVQQVAAPAQAPTEVKQEAAASNLYELESPLVGTFYASPKPDAPPFVEVGDKITKGQTLCIVEAMKNFNEIESEVNGVLKEICLKTGDLVEFNQVLFKIEQQ